jgi:uncharacterized protein (DUF305 family)
MIGMTPSHAYRFALSMAAALALAAGSGATRGAAQTAAQPASTSQDEAAAIAAARADSARYPYTAADIHFMTGMIPHHAELAARSPATRAGFDIHDDVHADERRRS